jgi:uncharacterized membrane protein YdfJ with MMPL/SSD domain
LVPVTHVLCNAGRPRLVPSTPIAVGLIFLTPAFAVVLLDATLIRGVLLPATMKLLGEWNWYVPRWLNWLPRRDRDHYVPASEAA